MPPISLQPDDPRILIPIEYAQYLELSAPDFKNSVLTVPLPVSDGLQDFELTVRLAAGNFATYSDGICEREECPGFWAAVDGRSGARTFCGLNPLCESNGETIRRFVAETLESQFIFTPEGELQRDVAQRLAWLSCVSVALNSDDCEDGRIATLIDRAVELNELREKTEELLQLLPGGRKITDNGFEERCRVALGMGKSNDVLRPPAGATTTPEWKTAFAKFDSNGQPTTSLSHSLLSTASGKLRRGTILDAESSVLGIYEMKAGSSTFFATYQIRLQIYFSLVRGDSYTILTDRPLSSQLQNLINNNPSLSVKSPKGIC